MSVFAVEESPTGSGQERARQALDELKSYLQMHPESPRMTLVMAEGDTRTLEVSRESLELFAEILAHIAAGEGVTVVPRSAELTTQQAADLLNVSRPYLIKLLDAGDIDFHLVGRHRRIFAESLMRYRSEDDERRRAAADELSALAQEMG